MQLASQPKLNLMATYANPSPNIPSIVAKPHFFADFYSFHWSEFSFRLPLFSAFAVALCLFIGIAVGHPGGGLIAGGGAFAIGFGPNQRIADSRLIPMIAAIFATSSAALVGTLAGHRSFTLVVAASLSAFIYGILTARNTGISWVGQQASIALLIASAFPTGPKPAFIRAGLLAAGGAAQLVLTAAGLRLIPALRADLVSFASSLYRTVNDPDLRLAHRLRKLPQSLPALSNGATLVYSLRLVLTMALATEVYHRAGFQSGYWIPMTALLVQKPAFFETLTRASARIAGTLAGAWLCSLLIAHVVPSPVALAIGATAFALLAYATFAVNYGLYTACLTAYIVFLLSLNQIPGPVIAQRRAWCTIVGGLIALVFHIDALRGARRASEAADKAASPSATSTQNESGC